MAKTDFRAKVVSVAKSKFYVQREESERQKPSGGVARSVVGATFDPFIDCGRTHVHYVAKELNKHPFFKMDLVVGMA